MADVQKLNVNGTAYDIAAKYVLGSNACSSPENALLRSGGGRSDSSPAGDTWLFIDNLGAMSIPWGIKHEQQDNLISFYGAGNRTSYIDLSNGNVVCSTINSGTPITSNNIGSQSVNYATSAGSASSAGSVAWGNVSGKPSVFPAEAHTHPYLPTSGGTVTGPIEISTGNTNNYYNEGLRITRANNSWAGITLGSTGLSGAPDDGWFIATNPSTDFIISPNNSYDHVGLKLVDGGDAYWKNNTILHSGNSSVSKSGQTLTVTINGVTQSITNTDTNSWPSNYVTTDTTQTITGSKTFSKNITINPSYGPHLTCNSTQGNWVYINLNNGSNYFDIASRSTNKSGVLWLARPSGSDKGPYVDSAGKFYCAEGIYNGNGVSVSYDGHTHSGYASSSHSHNYLPLTGGTLSGSLRIQSSGSAWNEGIRIHPASNGWSGVVFCESSNSGDSGTSSNTWSIHNNEGTFGMYKNGSGTTTSSYYISNVSNAWKIGGSVTINNTCTATGFYQSSDERLKTFHDPIKIDFDKLSKLRKNYFKFNDKDKLEIGVSAQEIQEIYPEIVSTDDEGYLSVAYDKLSVIALAAIDELKRENNDLKDQLKAIKNILKEKGIL